MGVSYLHAIVPPSSADRCYPGSDTFHKIGGYTLNEARGRLSTIKQTLYTPMKQVKSGGYVIQVGQPSYLHKTALKTARGKHAVHPAKTPVNGNFMRVVASATAEDDGRMYNPQFNHHATDDTMTPSVPRLGKEGPPQPPPRTSAGFQKAPQPPPRTSSGFQNTTTVTDDLIQLY